MQRKNIIYIVCIIFVGMLCFFAGVKSQHIKKSNNSSANIKTTRGQEIRAQQEYKFTNELLDCEITRDGDFQELSPFKGKIQKMIDAELANHNVSHISLYFRDMNNGPWIGIKSDDLFYPASLLKVPLAIGIYKETESDAAKLDKTLAYINDDDSKAPKEKQFHVNEIYTVKQLVEHMLIYSDNTAAAMLNKEFPNAIQTVITDLNLQLSGDTPQNQQISVRTYGSLFRILFNASYLRRDNSETLLEIMSRSFYTSGLASSVPSDILVSHKFGERTWIDSNEHQLHDCGILYYPNHPYLLCIMTRGNSIETLTTTITKLSTLVYKEIDVQLKQP